MGEKVPIATQTFLYPMPVVLVSAEVDAKPNYMAVAWITRVNYQPPLLGIAIGKRKYTARGIQGHGEFGVSVPSRKQVEVTDYLGIVSGDAVDKSRLVDSFYGTLAHAPMARSCPLSGLATR